MTKMTAALAAEMVAKHGSVRSAAEAAGVGRKKIRYWYDKAVAEGLTARQTRVESAFQPMIVRLQDENQRLRSQIKEIMRDNLSAHEVRRSIFKLADVSAEPPKWLQRPKTKKGGITGVPCTIWSDWHVGEVVNPAEVNGVNEFNLTIAAARIQRLVERTIDLCFNHMTNPEYPGIVVNMLGDMVSGELHPELEATDECEVFPAILFARDHISRALETLADAYGRVFVPCAFGNHGRVFDRRPRAKRYVYRNADWLLCSLLEKHFEDDPRVQFMIPDTGESLYRVYGHRYMGVHGDDLGVRGGDGIIGAIGPIMRGEIKVHNSSSHIGRDYDTLLMGHWHQMLWLPRAIVNNTLKGYDEYARRMLRAPATPPAQGLWFTHPTRNITAQWEVRLDDKPVNVAAPWVSFPGEAA